MQLYSMLEVPTQTSTGAPFDVLFDNDVLFVVSKIVLGVKTSRNRQSSLVLGSRVGTGCRDARAAALEKLKVAVWPKMNDCTKREPIPDQEGEACGHIGPKSLPSFTVVFLPVGATGGFHRKPPTGA